MKKLMERILNRIERVEMLVAKIILVAMILVVGMQIFFRYVLNHPLTWPEELSGFLLIWLTFLVADILVKRNGHVEVDYFYNKFSPRVRKIITLIINLYIMIFLVFLVVSSIKIEIIQIHHRVGASLRIPKAMYTMAATFSSLSMFFSMLLSQWNRVDFLRALGKDGGRT